MNNQKNTEKRPKKRRTGRTPGSVPQRSGRPGRLQAAESSRITRRITAFSISVGVILIVAKLLVFNESHSVGILSSLVHSSLDLIAGLSSYVAVRYAARTPDASYRFGRGKAEGFSAILQVCIIVLAAVHLLEEAVHRFEHPEQIEQGGYAIAVMIFAILLTTWLLIAQTWAIKATGSLAVRGDRAHYIADMSANVAVIAGVGLSTWTPFLRADSLVGVGIALWLLYTAYSVGRMAWSQLMDQELPERERDLIRELALEDPRIKRIHNLRTRASGPHVHIQMQLDLDDDLTLTQSHDIIVAAENRMMKSYPAADILIHPHPAGCDHFHGNTIFHQTGQGDT